MASPFASQHQLTIPLPLDEGQTVTIQKLSGTDLERAQFEHMTGVLTGRGRNWATRFMQLASAGTATPADAERVIVDPLSGFDRMSLVKAGLKGWSYQEAGKPKKVTSAAIEDLDDEALEFLAIEILRATKPTRFQTVEDAETARKND